MNAEAIESVSVVIAKVSIGWSNNGLRGFIDGSITTYRSPGGPGRTQGWQVEHCEPVGTVNTMRETRRRATIGAVAGILMLLVGCGEAAQTPTNPAAKALTLRRCGAIFENTTQLQCYEAHFQRVAETEGLRTALDEVVAWHNDPNGMAFASHCHEVLHGLGVGAMRDAGGEDERVEVFTNSKVTCTGGFVHGALTEYYDQRGEESTMRDYETLCATLIDSVSERIGADSDSTGWLSWNCNHMLGHAIYNASQADLPAGAAKCAVFAEGEDQRLGCEAGFYMEHYLVMGRTAGEGYAKADGIEDVHSLCRAVDQTVARGCWSESGGMVYIHSGREWKAAGDACREQAPTTTFLEACYEGLGRNIAPYAGYEPDQMGAWCQEIGDSFAVDTCIIQVAGSQSMELDRVESGLAMCNTYISDKDRRNRCTQSVQRIDTQIDESGFGGGVGAWDR